MRTTPVGNLPGVFCTNFDNVLCHWKGGLDDTLLYFFLSDPDDPNLEAGSYQILGSLEFDFFVEDMKEARALARKVWGQFCEQILVADGCRLYVREKEETIRLSAEDTEKVFRTIENPPAPNEKLLAAFRAHREQLT